MYSMGFNSFWSFGSPAVQDLLTKSNLQLDELLDEDGLILEVKNHNQNLYEFLLREKNFKELISTAISIPDVEGLENNRKKIYKYPFTCADILSSDSQPIVNEFFKTRKDIQENTRKTEIVTDDDDEVNVEGDSTDKDTTSTENQTQEEEKENTADANEFSYLDHLFSFLDSQPLNLTSAGYFAKIVNNLLNKRPSELIGYIYERRPELLHKMIQHIYSKSIAEFLAKVLTFESSILANVNNEVYNDKRSDVLKEIIKKLEPESDIEEINNTAYLICEVFGKYNSMHCSHEILHNLLEQSIINYFFEVLKSGKSTSACAVALILGNIFAYYILVNSPKAQENTLIEENEAYPQANHAPQALELTEEIPLVASFIDNIDQIIKFIGSSSGENIPSQHGSNSAPFGSARLKVLELIIIAMKANNKKIYKKLIEHDFLETLFVVFEKHNWNNMLHSQVEKILSHIIDGNSEDIKTALFEKAKILDFIVNASKDTEYTLAGKHARKVRKGYLGHLIRLSNKIIESRDPVIHNSAESNETWKEYAANALSEANQRDKINIGGRDPRAPVEAEDVRLELPSYLQKIMKMPNKGDSSNDQNRNQDNDDDDDDDEEEKREEELEVEEVEDMEDEDDNKHHEYQSPLTTSEEFITDTEKHVVHGTSPEVVEEEHISQTTVPIRGRNSFDRINRYIPDYDEEVKEENENKYVLDAAALKTVEENLDARYYNNTYFKREEQFSADDVLKEFEGL